MVARGASLHEARLVWLMWGVIAASVGVTYARLPASDFYNVSGSGISGGLGRVIVLLGWPVSLASIALLAVPVDRWMGSGRTPLERRAMTVAALVSLVLCATIAWPGVTTASNLDVKWSNAPAACGVVLALAITAVVLRRCGPGPRLPTTSGDRVAIMLTVLLSVAALPWILANLGVYVGDIPGLSAVFMSKQILPEHGHPYLHAVHLGHHDGFGGWLLAVTALALRRTLPSMRATRLRTALACYLALLLPYGLIMGASDFWDEQLVKRGTTSYSLPSLGLPALTMDWALLAAAAVITYLAAFRALTRGRNPGIGSSRHRRKATGSRSSAATPSGTGHPPPP